MRAVALAFAFCLTAIPLWADARVTVLIDALRIPELVEALRTEGLSDAQALNDDMLNGQGRAFWQGQVSQLYAPTAIEDSFFQALNTGMDTEALDAAVQFFDSERGQRITEMEIAARKAMMDPSVEETAAHAFANRPEDDPHRRLLTDFITANDFLDLNVALTMSASYQFSRGLADGGLLQMSEDQILAQVWETEQTLRTEAQSWLNGYFLLAQQPLEISDLEAYVAFSRSPAGKQMNAALFKGYEGVFTDIAYGLGRAVALNAAGNDI